MRSSRHTLWTAASCLALFLVCAGGDSAWAVTAPALGSCTCDFLNPPGLTRTYPVRGMNLGLIVPYPGGLEECWETQPALCTALGAVEVLPAAMFELLSGRYAFPAEATFYDYALEYRWLCYRGAWGQLHPGRPYGELRQFVFDDKLKFNLAPICITGTPESPEDFDPETVPKMVPGAPGLQRSRLRDAYQHAPATSLEPLSVVSTIVGGGLLAAAAIWARPLITGAGATLARTSVFAARREVPMGVPGLECFHDKTGPPLEIFERHTLEAFHTVGGVLEAYEAAMRGYADVVEGKRALRTPDSGILGLYWMHQILRDEGDEVARRGRYGDIVDDKDIWELRVLSSLVDLKYPEKEFVSFAPYSRANYDSIMKRARRVCQDTATKASSR